MGGGGGGLIGNDIVLSTVLQAKTLPWLVAPGNDGVRGELNHTNTVSTR